MDYVLYEDIIITGGEFQTTGISTYMLPTAAEIPNKITMSFIEEPSKLGSFGAKGIAEIGFVPTEPAILNAITDAIGIRFTCIPLPAEKVQQELAQIQ